MPIGQSPMAPPHACDENYIARHENLLRQFRDEPSLAGIEWRDGLTKFSTNFWRGRRRARLLSRQMLARGSDRIRLPM